VTAKVLMLMGASSSAGKSLLATALCRIYARRGWRVAPFKAQNMSNNAAVCGGGEIGRAQAVQAYAAGVEPTVDMNPVLLKPEAGQRSQIVLRGRIWDTVPASEYYRHLPTLWNGVTSSLDRLRELYELIIIEGAGSPVELNLKRGDIVNMCLAAYARAPVLLVGDIDRGGIFAQLLGTLWLLEPQERALLQGFIINKFRGDLGLFYDGVEILQERGGLPVLGVVPYLYDHGIPHEDAVAIQDAAVSGEWDQGTVDIAVIRIPHISNFDDLDPLAMEARVRVRYIDTVEALGRPDAIILPGTKSTIADLDWLHNRGLSAAIRARAQQGVSVVGICGGYQMLGQAVHDPGRVESDRASIHGLGLLPVETTFSGLKATFRSQARLKSRAGFWADLDGELLDGYEIHMGHTLSAAPLYEIVSREGEPVTVPDGMSSPDDHVFGCYLHGLFDNDNLRRAWLKSLGAKTTQRDTLQVREAAFERLADAVAEALDMAQLDRILDAGV
jgi:adenosylcobyric acid synthase